MLPEHLKAQFWIEVEQALQQRHCLSQEDARNRIQEYQELVISPRVGDMIYHRDAEDVAATIFGIMQQGGVRAVEPRPAEPVHGARNH
jgi:hypothetical protein